MTTKRRLQSESESGEAGNSPTNAAKIQKTLNPEPLDEEQLPNLPIAAGHNLRVSVRVLRKKEERKESGGASDDTPDPRGTDECPSNSIEDLNNEKVQRKKRAWGLWSAEDQRLFFIALNECGKNFDAIELFFQTKLKKGKAPPSTATTSSGPQPSGTLYKHKEQIRTFYYRTWHKISKYIKFPDTLKKSSRELYALINYGELRKKVGNTLDAKKGGKLEELVFNGHTTVRCKGKSIRLRTPTCPALKRLSFDETDPTGKTLSGGPQGIKGCPKEFHLPQKVTLVLSPLLVNDFYRVNRLALSNPRVSCTLGLDRRLSSIIKKLETKFRPQDEKTWLNCVAILPPKSELKYYSGRPKSEFDFRIVPRPGSTLSKPSVTTQEPTTSTSLSLSHLQSKLETTSNDELAKNQPNELSTSDFTSPQEPTAVEQEMDKVEELSSPEVENFHSHLHSSFQNSNLHPSFPANGEVLNGNYLFKQESLEQGWNSESADQISIGELFLLMGEGADSPKPVIHLNYTWKKLKRDEEKVDQVFDDGGAFKALVKLANAELARKHMAKLSGGPNSNSSPLHLKRLPKPNVIQSPRSDLENGVMNLGTSSVQRVEGQTSESLSSTRGAGFRRPAVPPARSAQHQAFAKQMDLLLPKYNQRKGRTMSRPKSFLARQLQAAAKRPLQPKTVMIQDGILKHLVPPLRPSQLVNHNQNIAAFASAAIIPSQITLTVQPQVSARPFLEIGRQNGNAVLIETSAGSDVIPQISIPSPAYSHQHEDEDEQDKFNSENNQFNGDHIKYNSENNKFNSAHSKFNNDHNDSFSVNISSLFDDNSTSGLDAHQSSRAITSTPSHLQVDHFLDSVLENSNSNDLLQTPRRQSPPPSPPGGINEHSWLPELSLSSFLGSLPTDNGVTESPSKMLSHAEDSIQSTGSEVDRQLTMMLNENSLDFTSKFAHLASALNSTD